MGNYSFIMYGIVVPRLSPEVIKQTEELDFVIIQMPKNQNQIRYSEVIVEVMARILKERPTENIRK